MMDTAPAAHAVGGCVIGGGRARSSRVTTDTRGLAPRRFVRRAERRALRRPRFRRAGARRGRRRSARRAQPRRRRSPAPDRRRRYAARARRARDVLARAASTFRVVGVTGSNGKTTTKEMIAAIFRAAVGRCRGRGDAGQLQQRDRPAAHAARVARAASTRRVRDRHEPSRRDARARGNRAADDRLDHQRAARAPGIHAQRRRGGAPSTPTSIACAAHARHGDRQRRRCARRLWRAAAARGGAPRRDVRARSAGRRLGALRAHPRAARSSSLRRPGTRTSCCASPAATWRATRSPRRRPRTRPALPLDGDRRAASKRFVRSHGRLVAITSTSAASAVIDDSYNANPDSVRAAIDVLAARAAPRWLVLGDMGEVGDARSRLSSRDRRLCARRRRRSAVRRRHAGARSGRRVRHAAPSTSPPSTRWHRGSPAQRAPA